MKNNEMRFYDLKTLEKIKNNNFFIIIRRPQGIELVERMRLWKRKRNLKQRSK